MDRPGEEKDLHVLVLEPYCGGSHKHFLSGLHRLPFHFEFMTLPARKWKWRMRLAAPFYARKLHELGKRFDRIFCSSYVDVATFRGLAPEWVRDVPLLTYFHENQFAYPVQVENERDLHFSLTNITAVLASDSVAFNSRYNLTSFLDGVERMLKLSSDMKLNNPCGTIRARSRVIAPGIDFSVIDAEKEPAREGAPVIVWNHRWEHDKNPVPFFEALFELDREGLAFRLIMLGESFTRYPPIFDEARERLAHRLVHAGYCHSRRDYARWLKQGDIAVSTSLHEFFGIAMIESARAGCRPLIPNRLSYPELFPEEFLYDEDDLLYRLRQEVARGKRLTPAQAEELTEAFSWDRLAPEYTAWIKEIR